MVLSYKKASAEDAVVTVVCTEDRPFRVLQLSDMQIINIADTRNATRDRQIKNAYFKEGVPDMDVRCFQYVYELVERTKPDLIVLCGDNIYGEFDDKGEMLKLMIERMEELGVPWAPLFGNHDAESRMGITRQMERLGNAPTCLFTEGNCTGHSNYAIRICCPDGTDITTLYLLDTNGCVTVGNPHAPEEGITADNIDYDKIEHCMGIYPDQIAWYRKTAEHLAQVNGRKVPSLAFFHIPIHMYDVAFEKEYGYVFGQDFHADHSGDQGVLCEHNKAHVDPDDSFYRMARSVGTNGFFTGHEHKNDAVIHHDGAVFAYGVKTGIATYYRDDAIGGTLISVSMDGTFKIQQEYCQKRMDIRVINQ